MMLSVAYLYSVETAMCNVASELRVVAAERKLSASGCCS